MRICCDIVEGLQEVVNLLQLLPLLSIQPVGLKLIIVIVNVRTDMPLEFDSNVNFLPPRVLPGVVVKSNGLSCNRNKGLKLLGQAPHVNIDIVNLPKNPKLPPLYSELYFILCPIATCL